MPAQSKKAAEMQKHCAEQNGNHCRPGYKPVAGKKPGSKGSCEKK